MDGCRHAGIGRGKTAEVRPRAPEGAGRVCRERWGQSKPQGGGEVGRIDIHRFGEALAGADGGAPPKQVFSRGVGGAAMGAGRDVETSFGLVRGSPGGPRGDMGEDTLCNVVHPCQGVLD